jgi:hypothetical protein
MVTREAWHVPDQKTVANFHGSHYHGPHGTPICGADWHPGRASADLPPSACVSCTKILRSQWDWDEEKK